MLVRSLSVVDEDDQENLVSSYSMHMHGGIHGFKNRLSKKGPLNDSGRQDNAQVVMVFDEKDEQDSLLYSSNYGKEQCDNDSFNLTDNIMQVAFDESSPGGGRSKNKSYYAKNATSWSMSTDAKTSAGSGKMLNGVFFNEQLVPKSEIDPTSKKFMDNEFDEMLVKTKGDMYVVMRISENL